MQFLCYGGPSQINAFFRTQEGAKKVFESRSGFSREEDFDFTDDFGNVIAVNRTRCAMVLTDTDKQAAAAKAVQAAHIESERTYNSPAFVKPSTH